MIYVLLCRIVKDHGLINLRKLMCKFGLLMWSYLSFGLLWKLSSLLSRSQDKSIILPLHVAACSDE